MGAHRSNFRLFHGRVWLGYRARVPNCVDLSTPALRREALRMVDVRYPRPHHAMLREIFDLERDWREGPDIGESDEYEQIYLAAFLLFLIGDPLSDVS